jgi:hypothetical protein
MFCQRKGNISNLFSSFFVLESVDVQGIIVINNYLKNELLIAKAIASFPKVEFIAIAHFLVEVVLWLMLMLDKHHLTLFYL